MIRILINDDNVILMIYNCDDDEYFDDENIVDYDDDHNVNDDGAIKE